MKSRKQKKNNSLIVAGLFLIIYHILNGFGQNEVVQKWSKEIGIQERNGNQSMVGLCLWCTHRLEGGS